MQQGALGGGEGGTTNPWLSGRESNKQGRANWPLMKENEIKLNLHLIILTRSYEKEMRSGQGRMSGAINWHQHKSHAVVMTLQPSALFASDPCSGLDRGHNKDKRGELSRREGGAGGDSREREREERRNF